MPTESRHAPPVRRLDLAPAAPALAVSACATNTCFIDDQEGTKPLARLTMDPDSAEAGDAASRERSLDRFSAGMHAIATRLHALRAPKDAQDEPNRLVASIDASADSGHASVVALLCDDPARTARTVKRLQSTPAELGAAEQGQNRGRGLSA